MVKMNKYEKMLTDLASNLAKNKGLAIDWLNRI